MHIPLTAFVAVHKEQPVIVVQFAKDDTAIKRFKTLPGARWSQTLKSWYLPDTPAYRVRFGIAAKSPTGKAVLAQISETNKPALAQMEQLLILKNYSPSTRKTYLVEFAQLLYVLKNNAVECLDYVRLRKYFAWCLTEQKISSNQLHSRINAVKFYFENILHKDDFYVEVPRPKKQLILPKVIGEAAILKLLEAAAYPKHKLLLSLCYGMGLRVSEICALKIVDIDSVRMQVNIVAGKGKKDRYVNLPVSILAALRDYYRNTRPKIYLFEGQYGEKYSIRSAQKV